MCRVERGSAKRGERGRERGREGRRKKRKVSREGECGMVVILLILLHVSDHPLCQLMSLSQFPHPLTQKPRRQTNTSIKGYI